MENEKCSSFQTDRVPETPIPLIFSKTGALDHFVILLLVIFIFLLSLTGTSQGQDLDRMKQISKQMENLSKKMAACGTDAECMQKVGNEMQQLSEEIPNFNAIIRGVIPPPGLSTRLISVPITVRVVNLSEQKIIQKYKHQVWVSDYYIFEYEAEEEGFLTYEPDFKSFIIEAPSRSFLGAKQPKYFKIRRQSGYTQGWEENFISPPKLVHYRDGEFIDIASSNKTFFFQTIYPHINKNINVEFIPIALLVRSGDGEYPERTYESYPKIGTDIGYRIEFLITPEMIRALLKTNRLQKTFRRIETFDEYGSFHENDLTVTIDLNATPGVLSVSPVQGFNSTGPDDKRAFAPSSKTYTLKNTGRSAIDYSIFKSKDWLNLSSSYGTLQPQDKTVVVVSINENANKLKGEGPYTDKIKFTNVTNNKGNTARLVNLTKEEHWRATIDGWNTLFFGDNILSGGLKVRWRIQVEFKIKENKYKSGSGKTYFTKVTSHSKPAGVYDCIVLKGMYLDKARDRYPTPYIKDKIFSVPGIKKGSMVSLTLPDGNFYIIGYNCVMDTDRAKEAFSGIGAIKPENRVRQSRKLASIKDGRPLPSGILTVPLIDGWQRKFGETKSIDAHRITVQKIQ